jgi:hypothetical protein
VRTHRACHNSNPALPSGVFFFAKILPNKKPARGVNRAGHYDQRFMSGGLGAPIGGLRGSGENPALLRYVNAIPLQEFRELIMKLNRLVEARLWG